MFEWKSQVGWNDSEGRGQANNLIFKIVFSAMIDISYVNWLVCITFSNIAALYHFSRLDLNIVNDDNRYPL